MTPLRILHVAPYYEDAWAYGGIPRLATTLTRALARRGHHVTVCTTDARDARSRAAPGRHDGEPVDVRVFPNVSNHLAYHWQFFTPRGLRAYLADALGRTAFDVAHVHACFNLPGTLAARMLSGAGVPYIVQPNGTARPIERRILAKRVFARTAGRGFLERAARVVAVTRAERNQLAADGIADSRLTIVPNPIDEGEFSEPPAPDRFRTAHALGDEPVVLYLGKLTPRKGIDVLIRAFDRLQNRRATLVIAGNDMGAGGDVDAAIRASARGSRIRRVGLLTGRDRHDALAAASVVAYPSRDEIFGLVPLEALLSGTPVVVCGDSGCGEVIGGIGGGHIVSWGDIDALSGALDAVLASPELWTRRAAAAAVRVRAAFGSDGVARQIEDVYAAVLACSPVLARGTA